MEIKTITCHNVYNYGASLQAYALQFYLEGCGHNVEIIDFNPWFHRDRYNLWFIYPAGRGYRLVKKCPLLKYIIGPLRNRKMFVTYGRKARFDAFTRNFLHLTSTNYTCSADLCSNPPQADIYIAGSDQIWNTDCENGKEPGYFLDFGGDVKRISYAASFGGSSIKLELKDFVASKLANFDAISVRESSGIKILRDLGFGGVQVLDPVFLLPKKIWADLSKEAKNYGLVSGQYILVYDFLLDERIANIASLLKQKYHLPIVSINDFITVNYADKNINDAGPLEFLSLVKNAKTIVSSSFHATAFSAIFEKDFYVFPLKGVSNSSRMEDFLTSIAAYRRFNCSNLDEKVLDFAKIAVNLESRIEESYDFLFKNIVK